MLVQLHPNVWTLITSNGALHRDVLIKSLMENTKASFLCGLTDTFVFVQQ